MLTFFTQAFHDDIQNLLKMTDMWRSRAPPTPLDFEGIQNGTFTMSTVPPVQVNGTLNHSNGVSSSNTVSNTASSSRDTLDGGHANGYSPALKDQKELTLKENLELFISA